MATVLFHRSSGRRVGGLRSDVHLIYVNRRAAAAVLIHSTTAAPSAICCVSRLSVFCPRPTTHHDSTAGSRCHVPRSRRSKLMLSFAALTTLHSRKFYMSHFSTHYPEPTLPTAPPPGHLRRNSYFTFGQRTDSCTTAASPCPGSFLSEAERR